MQSWASALDSQRTVYLAPCLNEKQPYIYIYIYIYDVGPAGSPSPSGSGSGVPPPCGVVDGVGGVGGLSMEWRTEWVFDWLASGLSEILLKCWEIIVSSISIQH